MTYLLRRGRGARRRKAHLARYNAWGQIAGSWCGRSDYDLSSNVPWGRPTCRDCLRKEHAAHLAAA